MDTTRRLGWQRLHPLPSVFINRLKPLPACKSGFEIVPPFDLVAFAHLPAEQHETVVAHRRKVDQPAFVIFELYAEVNQFLRVHREPQYGVEVIRAARDAAASTRGGFRGATCLRYEGRGFAVRLTYALDDEAHDRQQSVGFFDGEKLHE